MGRIVGLDHVAFDVVDLERSTSFYREVFDAQVVLENPALLARQLLLGGALLSLHQLGSQLGPTLLAGRPTAGAADFCMTWEGGSSRPLAIGAAAGGDHRRSGGSTKPYGRSEPVHLFSRS